MTEGVQTVPRPLSPGDMPGARALLDRTFADTPYLDRALEVLSLAGNGGVEHRALVVEVEATVTALAVFGDVAGAAGAARLHVIAIGSTVGDPGIGWRLLDAVAGLLRQAGTRFILAEMPDDPAISLPIGVLLVAGFLQEARFPDLFRDGVGLVFLRRDL